MGTSFFMGVWGSSLRSAFSISMACAIWHGIMSDVALRCDSRHLLLLKGAAEGGERALVELGVVLDNSSTSSKPSVLDEHGREVWQLGGGGRRRRGTRSAGAGDEGAGGRRRRRGCRRRRRRRRGCRGRRRRRTSASSDSRAEGLRKRWTISTASDLRQGGDKCQRGSGAGSMQSALPRATRGSQDVSGGATTSQRRVRWLGPAPRHRGAQSHSTEARGREEG